MPEILPDPIVIPTNEAARLLGISRNHVYELLDQKRIEGRYIGRRRLVLRASLD